MTSLYNLIKEVQQFQIRQLLSRRSELDEDDVNEAWKVIIGGSSSIPKNELLDQLKIMDPHVSITEVNKLVGPGSLTKSKLESLLLESSHKMQMDNVNKKAYDLLDPYGKGRVSVHTIMDLLKAFKPNETFSQEDVDVVTYLLGLPRGEQTFTEADYKQLSDWKPTLEELTPTQKKLLSSNSLIKRTQQPGSKKRQ